MCKKCYEAWETYKEATAPTERAYVEAIAQCEDKED